MNEHFEEQLKNTEALTEESIQALKQSRIDNDLSTASLDGLVPGDKFLFVMIERDAGPNENGGRNLTLNIEKILETEIEEFEASNEFLEMAGNGSLPRYKEQQ